MRSYRGLAQLPVRLRAHPCAATSLYTYTHTRLIVITTNSHFFAASRLCVRFFSPQRLKVA